MYQCFGEKEKKKKEEEVEAKEERRRKKMKWWRKKKKEEDEKKQRHHRSGNATTTASRHVSPNLFFLFLTLTYTRPPPLFQVFYYFNWIARNGGGPHIGPHSDQYVPLIPYHL